MPRLLAFLRSIGIAISKRQLVRLLNENHEGFIAEAQNVLSRGAGNIALGQDRMLAFISGSQSVWHAQSR
jgi:hypothetical protein